MFLYIKWSLTEQFLPANIISNGRRSFYSASRNVGISSLNISVQIHFQIPCNFGRNKTF